jgi:peptide/nickel transport system substrate-binding protein
MNSSFLSFRHVVIAFTAVSLFSCGGKSTDQKKSGPVADFSVKVRMNPEPAGLNPITINDQNKTVILSYISYSPVAIDLKKLDWAPVLAKEMPVLENLPDGKQKVTIEIREEATWDNGTPVTAEDALFSLKLGKLPTLNQGPIRGYYRDIEDLVLDPNNPKKYSVIFAQPYMLSATIAGDMAFFPKYFYDPKGALDHIKIKDLYDQGDDFKADSSIVKYSEWFSSEKFNRDSIIGCGPYSLVSWESGARITLKRKKDWWGDKVKDDLHYFQAYPSTLVFEFIKDETAAITALKSGEIDMMYSIDPMVFTQDLLKSDKFQAEYNTYTPELLGYESIGINMRKEPFVDVRVRKALAHLADVDRILTSVYYGLGQRINSYIPAIKKDWINNQLVPYNYDIAKAKTLLAEAGWVDSDGNGILDKKVNGRKKEFKIDLMYNAGNVRREKIALLYAEDLLKAGIKAEIKVVEIPVMVDNLKKHNFDIYIGGFIQSVIESDPYQLWHTESAKGGTNFPGYGDAVSDSLIDSYRLETDVKARQTILKDLQRMINEQVPVVFLCTGKERIAIKKSLTDLVTSDQRPGFWLGSIKPTETATK